MAKFAKFLVALAGAGTQIVNLGFLSGDLQGVVTAGISLLTAIAVFMVPNQTIT